MASIANAVKYKQPLISSQYSSEHKSYVSTMCFCVKLRDLIDISYIHRLGVSLNPSVFRTVFGKKKKKTMCLQLPIMELDTCSFGQSIYVISG